MYSTKIRQVGSSSGILLSRELMAELGAAQGDTLHLTKAADGGFRITLHNDEFERQMRVAEEVMHEHRDVLKALASR
jgi:putative addiction module antidote